MEKHCDKVAQLRAQSTQSHSDFLEPGEASDTLSEWPFAIVKKVPNVTDCYHFVKEG